MGTGISDACLVSKQRFTPKNFSTHNVVNPVMTTPLPIISKSQLLGTACTGDNEHKTRLGDVQGSSAAQCTSWFPEFNRTKKFFVGEEVGCVRLNGDY